RELGARARPTPPGSADAVRATVGVVLAYGAALVVAALVSWVIGAANDGIRSAGDTRAQLAVQAVIFAAGALLLVEGLRLSHHPREADPLAAAARERPLRPDLPSIAIVGVGAAALGLLIGPVVGALLPSLHDTAVPVDDLGVGLGVGADAGTVLVVAGLIPLGEELLFRGVLVGAWARAGRPGVAALVSAGLFGLAHVTVGPRAMVVMVLLGGLLAAAMLLARTLAAPVLAHALVNAVALVDGGLDDPVPLVVLVLTVLAATAVASGISRAVALPDPPVGTLER
ncbi:MAG: CPBP family intramembrane metalloprotease, partial [Solirubrobacteraceae bacterium]|nr:CPBP family intramembrane metalloprotease [Solirubrobacteraceae bacterium]